jgi:hypothetical protein
MANITAQLVTGRTDWGAEPPVLVETVSGFTGTQDWLIRHAPNEALAQTAPELPTMQTPWSTQLPLLRPVSKTFRRIGGTYNTPTQSGVHYWCRIEYATPAASGRLPDPRPGDKYMEFVNSDTTITRRFDARKELGSSFQFVSPPGPVIDIPIAGGRGMTVEVGQVALRIVEFMPAGRVDITLLRRLIDFQTFKYVNKDQITTPPLYGTDDRFVFRTGELRYGTFNITTDRGVTRLEQTVHAATDWFFRWVGEDETGAPEGEPYLNVAYPSKEFAGLW